MIWSLWNLLTLALRLRMKSKILFLKFISLIVECNVLWLSQIGWFFSPNTLHPYWFFFFFCLFRATPMAYGDSQARVESELQLLAYSTATATSNPSRICDLHHSSQQHQVCNPLSKARDWTHILIDPSWVHNHWAMMGTPFVCLFYDLLR